MSQVQVKREAYERNGKTYHSHFVEGVVRGTNVKIALVPQDFGGYTALDIVFGDQTTADLVAVPFAMKDDFGKIVRGNTFVVRSVDPDGTVYECPLKPAKASDKTMLNMLLR